MNVLALCAGGPVTRTAHEIMLPKVSDEQCAQFWGIAASMRLCAGHSSSASLGICSVSPLCASSSITVYFWAVLSAVWLKR